METPRTEFVKCRVTPDEKRAVDQHARNKGMDTAELLRELVFGDMANNAAPAPPSLLEELDEMIPKRVSGTAKTFGVGWPD